MINFTNPDESVHVKRRLSRKVTEWVENALPDAYEQYIVMVNEMNCYEPVRSPNPNPLVPRILFASHIQRQQSTPSASVRPSDSPSTRHHC
jgi:hypothetical protein